MPLKYLRKGQVPILLRHNGPTTLPERPPFENEADRSGAVVVCLHDAGLQSSVFEELLIALEGLGLPALAFDLPGHGRSGSLDALPSIAEMAAVAEWVAEACAASQPVVFGHGMGALVGLEWARTSPSRVRTLALSGAGSALSVSADAADLMRQVSRGKAPRPFDPSRVCPDGGPEPMKRAYMEGLGTDPRATLGDLEAILTWTEALNENGYALAPADADASKRRTLFIDGAASFAAASSLAEAREAALRWFGGVGACEAAEIPGAGHFLPFEQPAALAAALRTFVRGQTNASGGAPS